ncbi:hypothetical protein EIP86_009373 [Pleurotus ostreatoroseus]|nr:hypothetical protein EIP86_009373 [Pleurotus ostreatoroseus]
MGFAIGSTITGGIQDVSALLPLLGTEQCEDHVGSSLIGGFLYASASSLSIFGSLGIARASAKALAASIIVNKGGSKIMGAHKLADAGFEPTGKALSQIMWRGTCFVAEMQLGTMLEELHIMNVEKLTVDAVSSIWNQRMLYTSIVSIVLSITPYIYLMKNNHDDPTSLRWLFPVARSFGSLILSNMTQFVIQTRLLEIIRHRIVFLTMDTFVHDKNIKLPHEWKWWDARLSSEIALSRLETRLKAKTDKEAYPTVDLELLSTKLDETKRRHLPLTTRFRHTMLLLAQIAIAVGLVLTLSGYIGCFSLVQSSNTSFGPIIWLVTEVVLSLLRMGLWAWNPAWDERQTFLTFDLELSRNSPLSTCNKFSEELDEEAILPLTRPREFLGEITSFVGLLEPFRITEDGVAVYYTMTRRSSGERKLYVTIFDYKENVLRTLISPSQSPSGMDCRATKLGADDGGQGDIVWATMHNTTSMDSNHLTRDLDSVAKLRAHCGSIIGKLRARTDAGPKGAHAQTADTTRSPLSINVTWELKLMDQPEQLQIEQNNPKGRGDNNDITWTADDKDDREYLKVGSLERARRHFCLERSQWTDECISLIIAETLEALPWIPENLEKRVQQDVNNLYNSEAAAAECLILYELEQMELILIEETRALEDVLKTHYLAMVNRLEKGRGGDVDLVALKRKLFAERKTNILRRITKEEERVQQRLKRLRNEAHARIKERGFRGATEAWLEDHWQKADSRIQQAWEKLKGHVQCLSDASDDANEAVEQVSVADACDVYSDEDFGLQRMWEAFKKLAKPFTGVDEASRHPSVSDNSDKHSAMQPSNVDEVASEPASVTSASLPSAIFVKAMAEYSWDQIISRCAPKGAPAFNGCWKKP